MAEGLREVKDLTDEELAKYYREFKKEADYRYSILKELEAEIDRRTGKDKFIKEELN